MPPQRPATTPAAPGTPAPAPTPTGLASPEEFAAVIRRMYPTLSQATDDDRELTHAVLTTHPVFQQHVIDPLEGIDLLAPVHPRRTTDIELPAPPRPIPVGTPDPTNPAITRYPKGTNPAQVAHQEVTPLSPAEEQRFQAWAAENQILDVDHPQAFYDYRGFWKEHGDRPVRYGVDHFPDTYKQHGHPTFSTESQYSRGPGDGGQWRGDQFVPATPAYQPPPPPMPSTYEPLEGLAGLEQRVRGYAERAAPTLSRILAAEPAVAASEAGQPPPPDLSAGRAVSEALVSPVAGTLRAAQGAHRVASALGKAVQPAFVGQAESTAEPTTGRELAGGAAQAVGGALEAGTLLIPEGLLRAPLTTGVGLFVGMVADAGVRALGEQMGVAPEYTDLAAVLSGLAAGVAAGHYIYKNEAYYAQRRAVRERLGDVDPQTHFAEAAVDWYRYHQETQAQRATATGDLYEKAERLARLGKAQIGPPSGSDRSQSPFEYFDRLTELEKNPPLGVPLRQMIDQVYGLSQQAVDAQLQPWLDAANRRLQGLPPQPAPAGPQLPPGSTAAAPRVNELGPRSSSPGGPPPGPIRGAPPGGRTFEAVGPGPAPTIATTEPGPPPEPLVDTLGSQLQSSLENAPPPMIDVGDRLLPQTARPTPAVRQRLRTQQGYRDALAYTVDRMTDEMDQVVHQRGRLVNEYELGTGTGSYYVPPVPGSSIYWDVVGPETRNPPTRSYITAIMRAYRDSGGTKDLGGLSPEVVEQLRRDLGLKTERGAKEAYRSWVGEVHRVVDAKARQILANPKYGFGGEGGEERPTGEAGRPPAAIGAEGPPGPIEEAVPDFLREGAAEDIDEPGVSGMRVSGPPGHLAGEGRIRLGGVSERGANIMGASLYRGQLAPTVVRELLQNALDTGSTSVVVRVGRGTATGERPWVEVEDDGPGLTLAQMETVFSNLFESGKTADPTASGGFGVAKAAPFKAAEAFRATSVVDEVAPAPTQGGWRLTAAKPTTVRMRHTWEGTSETVAKDEGTRRTSERVPDDTPTGVTVRSWFKHDALSPSEIEEIEGRVRNLAGHSRDLPQQIKVVVDGRTRTDEPQQEWIASPPSTGNLGNLREMARAPGKVQGTRFGDLVLYMPSEVMPASSWADRVVGPGALRPNVIAPRNLVRVHILNNGRYALTDQVGTGLNMAEFQLPEAVVVDLKVDTAEGERGYPFLASRDELHYDAERGVEKLVEEQIIKPARDLFLGNVDVAFDRMPTLPDSSSVVYDVGSRYTSEELARLSQHPFIRGLADLVDESVQALVGELYPSRLARIAKTGLMFHDRIGGLNIKRGTSGAGRGSTEHPLGIVINPFILFRRLPVHEVSISQYADQLYALILHEVTHVQERSEGAEFTFEENMNFARGAAVRRHFTPQLERLLEETVYAPGATTHIDPATGHPVEPGGPPPAWGGDPWQRPDPSTGHFRADFAQLYADYYLSRGRPASRPDPLFDAQGAAIRSPAGPGDQGAAGGDRAGGVAGAGDRAPGGGAEGRGPGEQPGESGVESATERSAATPVEERDRASLFERLKGEEGHLILNARPTKDSMTRWLNRNRDEYGSESWFEQAESALRDNDDPLTAFRVVAITAAQQHAAATPGQPVIGVPELTPGPQTRDQITGQFGGSPPLAEPTETPWYDTFKDHYKELLGKEFSPAKGVGVDTAGNLVLGQPEHALRASVTDLTLGRYGTAQVIDQVDPTKVIRVAGKDRDARLRIFHQMASQLVTSMPDAIIEPLMELLHIPDRVEFAKHFERKISDAGKTLRMLKDWQDTNWDQLIHLGGEVGIGAGSGSASDVHGLARIQSTSEFAKWFYTTATEADLEKLGILNAYRQQFGAGVDPQVETTAGKAFVKRWFTEQQRRRVRLEQLKDTIDEIAGDNWIDKVTTATALEPVGARSTRARLLDQIENTSRAFMISKPSTAIRNLWSQFGAYNVGILDDALSSGFAHMTGDHKAGERLWHRASEMAKGQVRFRSGGVTPSKAMLWENSLQALYDFTADSIAPLAATDARKTLSLLDEFPKRAASYLGSLALDPGTGKSSAMPGWNERLRNFITVFNRTQEYSFRATVFDSIFRAQLRDRGLDPNKWLAGDPNKLIAQLGERTVDRMIGASVSSALHYTFASNPYPGSIPAGILSAFTANPASPLLRLAFPFPRFNFVNAPRWLYDHGPMALFELPLQAWSYLAEDPRGRLFRGRQAAQIATDLLPQAVGRVGQAEYDAATQLQAFIQAKVDAKQAASAFQALEARLEKAGGAELPQLHDNLLAVGADLQARMEAGEAAKQAHREAVRVLKERRRETRVLEEKLSRAEEIGAPKSYGEWIARMSTGLAMFTAAYLLKSQSGSPDDRWYEYTTPDLPGGVGKHTFDLRPYAPFVQYLLPADGVHDVMQHTHWDEVGKYFDENPQESRTDLNAWEQAMRTAYDGKYTNESMARELLSGLLSISPAAGTTATLTGLTTDVLSGRGAIPAGGVTRTAAGTVLAVIGQFLGRFTVPLQVGSEIAGEFREEEAIARIPEETSREGLHAGSLVAGPTAANIPFVREAIEPKVSPLTGQPIQATNPLMRTLAGLTERQRNRFEAEINKTGIDYGTMVPRSTGDRTLDNAVAEEYHAILGEGLRPLLDDVGYQQLPPEIKRDVLSSGINDMKRAAFAQAAEKLKLTEDQTQHVLEDAGTRARRVRWMRHLDRLDNEVQQEQEKIYQAHPELRPGEPGQGNQPGQPPPPPLGGGPPPPL